MINYRQSAIDGQEPKTRRRRATPLVPWDVNTWHEADLEKRLKELLRLGHWRAIHVRKQGDRKRLGREHAGLLESVPLEASWGWPDWFCVPVQGPDVDHELYLELKSERGKVTEEQAVWLMILAQMGRECVVVRPRMLLEDNPLMERLVLHRALPTWRAQQVTAEMHLPEVMRL